MTTRLKKKGCQEISSTFSLASLARGLKNINFTPGLGEPYVDVPEALHVAWTP